MPNTCGVAFRRLRRPVDKLASISRAIPFRSAPRRTTSWAALKPTLTAAPPSLVSSRPAKSPVRAFTARTGWRATRCSKGSCSARVPRAPYCCLHGLRRLTTLTCWTRFRRMPQHDRRPRRSFGISCGGTWGFCGTAPASKRRTPPWPVGGRYFVRRARFQTKSGASSAAWRRLSRLVCSSQERRCAARRAAGHISELIARAATIYTGNFTLPIDLAGPEGPFYTDVHREHFRPTHRNHPSIAGLRPLVHRCRPQGRARGLLASEGLHGDPPLRLRDLGVDAAGPRSPLQGNGPRQRLLPALHSEKSPDEGDRARRRLRATSRVGDEGRHRGAR